METLAAEKHVHTASCWASGNADINSSSFSEATEAHSCLLSSTSLAILEIFKKIIKLQ